MIAAWMLLATFVSGFIALAAILIERAVLAFRRPTRFIWLGAIAVALSLSISQLFRAIDSASPGDVASQNEVASPTSMAGTRGSGPTSSASHDARAPLIGDVVSVPHWLSALDKPLMVLWIAGSTLWAVILVVSAERLRRQSRLWRDGMIEGSTIRVSEDVGPALFGIARYRIVMPAWALRLDASQQRMILEHEHEHARASDPALLLAGALLALLQPWNVVVWLLYRRLRFAIEADCDARVLCRATDVRAYGELLLDVGARAPSRLAPIVALSEAHSILERRISLMTRSPIARPGLRSVAALAAAAILFFAACQVPRPVASPTPPPNAIGSGTLAESRAKMIVASDSDRTIVKLTSLGLEGIGMPMTVLVFADGPARVGIGTAAPSALTDTLHLSSLPAMTMDVTESDVHLRLVGLGRMSVSADVTGGRASHFSATAQEIIVLKGGVGVRTRGL